MYQKTILVLSFVVRAAHRRMFSESTRNQIVFTMRRLILIQTDVHLDPNQSVHVKYNLISGWFSKISKIFLSLCLATFRLFAHATVRHLEGRHLFARSVWYWHLSWARPGPVIDNNLGKKKSTKNISKFF